MHLAKWLGMKSFWSQRDKPVKKKVFGNRYLKIGPMRIGGNDRTVHNSTGFFSSRICEGKSVGTCLVGTGGDHRFTALLLQ